MTYEKLLSMLEKSALAFAQVGLYPEKYSKEYESFKDQYNKYLNDHLDKIKNCTKEFTDLLQHSKDISKLGLPIKRTQDLMNQT